MGSCTVGVFGGRVIMDNGREPPNLPEIIIVIVVIIYFLFQLFSLFFSSMLPQKAYDTYLFKRFFESANPLNLTRVPSSSSND